MNYIDDYLKYLKVVKKDSNYTIKGYKTDLLELYDFTNDLVNISVKVVQEYLEYLYSRGLNRNSISRKLSAIRNFYDYLRKAGVVEVNFFAEVANPKKALALPKYAKDDDLEKIFQDFDRKTPIGQRNACILEMLYATGVRVGELVNIKVTDINEYNRSIKILGKGRKERVVFYGSYCADILRVYLNDGRNKLMNDTEQLYLFLNKNGARLSERFVRKIIDKAVLECGIDYHISPHTFRHTFATDMLNAGSDLLTVKDLLGHSSINTTGIYTHVSNEQIKKVYELAHPRSKEK